MYEAYWKLSHKPFESGADARVYYPGEAHQASLLKLRYAVESRSGGALLAGSAGCGKTLIVRLLAERLDDTYRPFVHVVFPQMPAEELLAYLAAEITAESTKGGLPSLDESVRRLSHFLEGNAAAGRHAVLAIDEAHLIEHARTFETLRLLMNFETGGRPAVTVLLVGQTGLLPMIDRMPQLDERMAAKCLLGPLTVEETMAYVQHRLSQAGAKRAIFTGEGLEAVYRLSNGVPRRINRLCDLALLIGYADEKQTIGSDEIEAVANDLVTVTPE